jgi:ferredoxin
MNKLNEKAAALLQEGTVKLIIGYEQGTEKPRPLFCTVPEDASRLIFNDQCKNNLAVYLTKKEIIGDEKIAVIATYYVMKSIVQLDKENQINKDNLMVLTVDSDGEVIEFNDYQEMEKYADEHVPAPNPKVVTKLEEIDNMSREERWAYWKSELTKCIRCYACRAACPLCYCNRCITEVNCPQWIDPWPTPLSNMEWQINRVMHMSGRCVGCGACAEACPLDLPIGLLTKKMAMDINAEFGSSDDGNVLSTFNPSDKENFIH